MTANERRLAIWDVMRQRRYDTAPHLAEEFGVSVRTIYRDIELLSGKFPFASRQGKSGGIYVEHDPCTLQRYLTPKQENLIREVIPTLSSDKQCVAQSILDSFARPRLG